MMTFEEFFKKKRIQLATFNKDQPVLYLEFKSHFEQMGEKSFDHTKKYWFNKLRRKYPLPLEVKTEKPKIENPLAEQTMTESLIENTPLAPSAKTGFVPRFKASNLNKTPVAGEKEGELETQLPDATEKQAETKPGYQPRFKMKPKSDESEKPAEEDKKPEQEELGPAKQAYRPLFNIKNVPPKTSEE